jgi:hypothetical protein
MSNHAISFESSQVSPTPEGRIVVGGPCKGAKGSMLDTVCGFQSVQRAKRHRAFE